MAELTQATLKEALRYEPEAGIFYKVTTGKECSYTNKRGYVIVSVKSKQHQAHRLAFLYMNGCFPRGYVDHKNTCKSDNRWVNLREATNQQNQRNRGLSVSNNSGHKGVSWNKDLNKWRVRIMIDNKSKSFGCFEDLELAALVAYEAQETHFKDFNYTGK